ncbi:hypothetical protein HELRODRAFT_77646, partial [Helobdella robusta]|uniref:DNA mismatch repair proteins mutS family domain-containing protein n=1 Tax=Helobdella robusta TaxID=6412 RepID=T1G315_HELRO
IIAVIEGRGNAQGEVGLACYDLNNSTLELYQFSDCHTYSKLVTKLNILNPAEVIMSNTVCEKEKLSSLIQQISMHCSTLKIVSVNRKYFNDRKGFRIFIFNLLQLRKNANFLFHAAHLYYCLAATNALFKYLEFVRNITFVPSSIKVVYKTNEHSTMMDITTTKNLELIRNANEQKSHLSLFNVLNNVKTQMGSKLLRSNILEPSCDLQTIVERLDMVDELLNNSNMFYKIRNALVYFSNINHILSSMVQKSSVASLKVAESKLTTLINLKNALEAVELLKDAFEDSVSLLFQTFHRLLSHRCYTDMLEAISSVVEDNTHLTKNLFATKVQKGYAIKAEANGLLDISRRTYSEAIEDINQLVVELREKYHLPIKSNYSLHKGFYLKIPVKNMSACSLPNEFLKIMKFKGSFIFTTDQLVGRDFHIVVFILIADNVLAEVMKNISGLYQLAECVGIVDVVASFAFNAIRSDHIRPVFTDTLAVKNSRHPILERMPHCHVISNSIYASEANNFVIISGPNMSGKSTYLSQIAILQIMAQIGSYVPAETASFKLCKQIFSRIGYNNYIGTNSSMLFNEMKEMNYVVQNVNKCSMIIIDELCKGTSLDEGVALFLAFCEHIKNFQSFCFIATHHENVIQLEDYHSNFEK